MKFSAPALSFALLLPLAACGGGDDTADTSSTGQAGGGATGTSGASGSAGNLVAGSAGTAQGGAAGTAQGGGAGTAQGGTAGTSQGGTAGASQAGAPQAGAAGTPQGGNAGTTQAGAAGTSQGGNAGTTQAGAAGTTQGGNAGTTQAGAAGTTQGGAAGTTQGGAAGAAGQAGSAGSSGSGFAERLLVPAGNFLRLDKANLPASVSAFQLDKYELTVGRFRTYVAALAQADRDALMTAMNACGGHTWTDAPGANEDKPINCIVRAEGLVICQALGGRLPTELEWNYAASGGEEQRVYPWSSPANSSTVDATHAVYGGAALADVGTKPLGAGRWGHLDLGGNIWEMTQDTDNTKYSSQATCTDCSFYPEPSEPRYIRRGGGANEGTNRMRNDSRDGDTDERASDIGLRCAYAAGFSG